MQSLYILPLRLWQLWRLTYWTRYSTAERIDIDWERMQREKEGVEKRELEKERMDGETNPAYTGSQAAIADSSGVINIEPGLLSCTFGQLDVNSACSDILYINIWSSNNVPNCSMTDVIFPTSSFMLDPNIKFQVNFVYFPPASKKWLCCFISFPTSLTSHTHVACVFQMSLKMRSAIVPPSTGSVALRSSRSWRRNRSWSWRRRLRVPSLCTRIQYGASVATLVPSFSWQSGCSSGHSSTDC